MQDDNKGRADLVPQPQEPTPEAVERAAEERCPDCDSVMIMVCSGLEFMGGREGAGECVVGTDREPQGREWQQEAVERAAEAYWREVYGRHRPGRDNWPDDVVGQSQDLIRAGTRAALIAARKAGEGI